MHADADPSALPRRRTPTHHACDNGVKGIYHIQMTDELGGGGHFDEIGPGDCKEVNRTDRDRETQRPEKDVAVRPLAVGNPERKSTERDCDDGGTGCRA